MSSSKRCWVYWIRLPEHTDIFTEGYVGITTLGVLKRYDLHKKAVNLKGRRGTHLTNAIKKYGEALIVDTVLEASTSYCIDMEFKLRSKTNTGWNIAVGGSAPGLGRVNSPEHNQKVTEASRGRKYSPAVVEANRQRGLKQYANQKDWLHPVANKSAWANARRIFDWLLDHPKDGRRTVGKALSIPSDSILILLKKIKSGWNPNEDDRYLAWLNTYKENNVT